jgi:hypothetical protein
MQANHNLVIAKSVFQVHDAEGHVGIVAHLLSDPDLDGQFQSRFVAKSAPCRMALNFSHTTVGWTSVL